MDKETGCRQQVLMKQISCLSNLTTFYDEMTGEVDERTADIYLDFTRAFNSPNTLIDELLRSRPDK